MADDEITAGCILLAFLIICVTLVVVYIPIWIAEHRKVKRENLHIIVLLSWFGLLFGVTWIIAFFLSLVYEGNATDGDRKPASTHIVVQTRTSSLCDPADELEKLAALKEKGCLTEDEFKEQKAKILRNA